MTKYKCGHESKMIITDSSPLVISSYLVWKDSTGFDGDKTECFDCYCKRINQLLAKNPTKGENKDD